MIRIYRISTPKVIVLLAAMLFQMSIAFAFVQTPRNHGAGGDNDGPLLQEYRSVRRDAVGQAIARLQQLSGHAAQ